MRTDSLDVSSLVSYINDIKPFHSKLTDVVVEYQANDDMFVKITDKSKMEMKFSSIWELQAVSDGKRVQYRIPAAVFPRRSEDFNQCKRRGVTDAIPGASTSYRLPYNNGVEVFVNGVKKLVNSDYVIDSARTNVRFIANAPKLGDEICLNWYVIDRVFIGVGEKTTVLNGYDSEDWFDGGRNRYDMEPYDNSSTYDEVDWRSYNLVYNEQVEGQTIVQEDVELGSIGAVRVLTDTTGKEYYVFEFDTAPALNTKIWIRVEQREAYNGWTQTKITDKVVFRDHFRFSDTVLARIVDPGTWFVDQDLFGIDITPSRVGNFDSENFDIMDYDSIVNPKQIGYYRLLSIRETLGDAIKPKFTEKYVDRFGVNEKDAIKFKGTELLKEVIKYNPKDSVLTQALDRSTGLFDDFLFDEEVFDSMAGISVEIKKTDKTTERSSTKIGETIAFRIRYADGTEVYQSIYSPNDKGVVDVTVASSRIEILHNYGYNPLVAVYLNNTIVYPKAIKYVSVNSVVVEFSEPRTVVIRLA
jgi:hypothetical protein